MMKSYTLENWDGRLANSEPLNTHNSTQGASSIWESGSHVLGNQNEKSMPRNDVPTSNNEIMHQNNAPNYSEATTSVNNDGSNEGGKARLFRSTDYESTMENMSPTNSVKPTLPDERIDASNGSQKTSRIFLPVENSLLHAFHAHVAPTSPALAKKLAATLLEPPSPTPQKNIEIISLYTTDAEGDEEEEEDVSAIQRLLISPTKLNEQLEQSRVSSPAYSGHDSLFSPPPSGRFGSSDLLFTPEPLSPKSSPRIRRERALYVDVPPLRGPKSAYKWMSPTRKVRSYRPPPVTYHGSLQDAYQALVENNFRDVQGTTKKPKKKKKEGSENNPPQNAIAGSSKHPIVVDPISNAAESASYLLKIKIKKRVYKDDETFKGTTKKQKRIHTHVDIDLTKSDGDNPVVQPKPKSMLPGPKPNSPKPVAAYNKGNNAPTIFTVAVVKPIDFEIWDFNIRFLRDWVKQQKSDSSVPFTADRAPSSRRKTGAFNKETPWLCRISSQPSFDEEEISLGGRIPTSWDIASGGEQDSNDEVFFVEPYSVQQQRPPQSPSVSVSSDSTTVPVLKKLLISRKIDLAARLRKKEKLSKGKLTSTISVPSTKPRSQGVFKPIVPSSPFNATTHQPYPGPCISPSQLVGGALVTVPPQLEQNSQNDEALGPSTPSAKALGKRKAIDNEPYDAHRPFRTFGFPSAHHDPTTHLQSNATNTDTGSGALKPFRMPNPDDIFIHNYVRSPSPILPPPVTVATAIPDGNMQILSTLYTPSDSLGHDIPPFVPTFEGGDGELGYPWGLGVCPDEEYKHQTVDPSLLVGGPAVEPGATEFSEPLPDYAADFAPTDDDCDDVELPAAPVAGPSGLHDRSRRGSSSPSVLEFPSSSSSENTPERESEPPKASITQHLKQTKRQSTLSYASSSDSDDEPLANLVAPRHRKTAIPSSSSAVYGNDYVPPAKPDIECDNGAPAKRKGRRALSSSSFYASEVLPEIVYVPSTGSRAKKGNKSSNVRDEASSDDKEYVPSMKPSLPRNTPPKREARRASSPSFRDVNFLRNKHAPSATPGIEVKSRNAPPQDEGKVDKDTMRSLPKRQRTQRQLPDFVDIDAFLREEGLDTGLPLPPKLDAVRKPARKAPAGPTTALKQHRERENWPQEEEELYCHQCRNKTAILKMICPSCDAKFCVRCLTLRYPDMTFFDGVEFVWTKGCPRCLKFCNCTACCSRRGETYVSSRGRPPGERPSLPSPPPASLPRYILPPGHTVQTLHATPSVLPTNAQYFATMYDLNGKRVGATYASTDGFSSIGIPTLSALTTRKKTVFVGMVQRSWGFSKHSTIKDLRPLPVPKQTNLAKGKSKEQRKMRYFVGGDAFARYRQKPEPYDPFGDLSSLSSLSSSEGEDEEPETDVEAFNPQSLTDVDVCRAISLGLQACGVVRIDVTGLVHTFTSL